MATKNLTWASKLHAICVLESPPEHIKKNKVKHDISYPFTLLPDEDLILYEKYKIEGSLCGIILGLSNMNIFIRARVEGNCMGLVKGGGYMLSIWLSNWQGHNYSWLLLRKIHRSVHSPVNYQEVFVEYQNNSKKEDGQRRQIKIYESFCPSFLGYTCVATILIYIVCKKLHHQQVGYHYK